MRHFFGIWLIMSLTTLHSAQAEQAATTLPGKDLALRSSGSAKGDAWTLDRNGYVGTYIQLAAPGKVRLSVQASGSSADAQPPRMNIVVADSSFDSNLTKDEKEHANNFDLPAGTWFVRIELTNGGPKSGRSATIHHVQIGGASVLNEHNDSNALAAAGSHVEHFRKGPVRVNLQGVSPGTDVHVKLKRHAFMFGTAVAGFESNQWLIKNPPAGSDAARYQAAITRHFQAITPGNAGKWVYNEKEKDIVTMGFIDEILQFAKDTNMRARMHTMLWDTGQQPEFIKDLLTRAAAGDEAAKNQLRQQITERIGYYVRDRAKGYVELDVLNESLHQPRYLNIFGIEGIADIHSEVARAIAEAGAETRIYINEFNVFQWSQLPPPFGEKETWDPYANWLREHGEAIRAAGGTVDGIGVQYYVNPDPTLPQQHSPARIFAVLQNLSVGGWPITLTEFGAKTGADESLAAEALEHTVRLVFGTPQATGFMMWGIWETEMWDRALGAAFYTKTWEPRKPLDRWESLMREWDTDLTLKAGDDGTIQFTGFWGDYDITIAGKSYPLTLEKRTSDYTVAVR